MLGLHSIGAALLAGRWLVLPVSLGVLLMLGLAAKAAGQRPRQGARLLVLAIYLASVAILVSTGWSPVLSSLGYVFAYAAPLVAGLLLSWRLALGLMLLNTLGFGAAVSGWLWPQIPPQWIRLPDSAFYIHAAVYAFFNISLPLAVYRLSAGMRAAQRRLELSLRLSEDVFQAASAPTLVCDDEDRVLRANSLFLALLGCADEALLQGQPLAGLLRPADARGPAPPAAMPPGWRQPAARRWWLQGGALPPCAVLLRAARRTAGGHWVYSFEDVTRQLRVQADLAASLRRERWVSRTDPVTGLPNRVRCCRLLDRLQRGGRRERQWGLLTLRLNNLRQLNARFGVVGGDAALCALAGGLRAHLPPGAIAARVRASVIAVLMPAGGDEALLLRQVQALRRQLPTLTHIDAQLAQLDLSFGLVCVGQMVLCDAGAAPPSGAEWLRRSELALDLVNDPRWRSQFDGLGLFNAQTAAQLNRAMAIEAALPQALSQGLLRLVYQPKMNAQRQLLGFEALARWHCEQLGEISPMEFIPAAEASGLIGALSDWVLQQACAQLALWRRQGQGAWSVAVNLSAHDLEREQLFERISAIVSQHGLVPADLQLEVTESALVRHEALALRQLQALHEAGFSIAVDDFGTGYSSLAKIVDLPLDVIKIDRSFLRGCPGDARRERVVRSIVGLAHSLHLQIVAEGVETPAQLDFLGALGVQGLQGYRLGRPQPAAFWSPAAAADPVMA